MAGTFRTPLSRRRGSKAIPPEAVEVYSTMQRLGCYCDKLESPPQDRDAECLNCQRWWKLHSQLVKLLQRPLWEYPLLRRKGEESRRMRRLRAELEEALARHDFSAMARSEGAASGA